MSQFLCSHEHFSRDTVKFIAQISFTWLKQLKWTISKSLNQTWLVAHACWSCTINHIYWIVKHWVEVTNWSTYIHEYEDIFDDDNIEEQYFIANILMANRKRKKEIESAQSYFPFAPLSSVLLCLPPWFWIY